MLISKRCFLSAYCHASHLTGVKENADFQGAVVSGRTEKPVPSPLRAACPHVRRGCIRECLKTGDMMWKTARAARVTSAAKARRALMYRALMGERRIGFHYTRITARQKAHVIYWCSDSSSLSSSSSSFYFERAPASDVPTAQLSNAKFTFYSILTTAGTAHFRLKLFLAI